VPTVPARRPHEPSPSAPARPRRPARLACAGEARVVRGVRGAEVALGARVALHQAGDLLAKAMLAALLGGRAEGAGFDSQGEGGNSMGHPLEAGRLPATCPQPAARRIVSRAHRRNLAPRASWSTTPRNSPPSPSMRLAEAAPASRPRRWPMSCSSAARTTASAQPAGGGSGKGGLAGGQDRGRAAGGRAEEVGAGGRRRQTLQPGSVGRLERVLELRDVFSNVVEVRPRAQEAEHA
jgi:hypothetical protein